MARLDVNIVTSLVGAGLEQEAKILREVLAAQDIYTVFIHYTNLANATMVRADINIFFEVIAPPVLSLSRENWFVPNCEWYDAKIDRYLNQFTRILCKTRHCYEIWCAKVGTAKCTYTSFEARDIYRPEIPREVKFLHLAGKSEHKNTEAVIRTWQKLRKESSSAVPILPLPHLTLVARAPLFEELCKGEFPDGNVTWIPKATDEQVIEMMNSHQFHILPSMYEGFGHALHEALGCGGIVLTTNAPPMNTFEGVWKDGLITVAYPTPRSLVSLNVVDCSMIEPVIRKAANLGWNAARKEELAKQSAFARTSFLANRDYFRKTITELVNSVKH